MEIYVDCSAPRNGDGSQSRPFRHINDAAQVAQPGDRVLVAPGVYREYVDPAHAGLEDAPIVYESTTPLGAVITGAEEVKSWVPYQGDVWMCRIHNGVFGSYNPYTTLIGGDWYFAPMVLHTGAVYLNGVQLYEAVSLDECIQGAEFHDSWEPERSIYKWYTCQEGEETLIYANFHGVDPNKENVEINVRRNCFLPSKTGVNYITLSGFQVTKAATTWAPPAAYQDGMVGPHWSKGWIIEDCDINNSKCCGISLGKYCDPDNDMYFTKKRVKSPTQMERDAVCRGQYHGWSKETVGSHIIRRCNIHHCEQTGIVGRMGCVFSTIENNHIHHINNMQQLCGAEIAGIKLHAAIDVTMRGNHIHHCTMGIWCDWQAQGTRITQNLLHDNYPPAHAQDTIAARVAQDLFVEVSHGPTLIDHNVLLSPVSLKMATQGVAVVHNLILGSFSDVGCGTDNVYNGVNQPRYTPYHIHHRTEVAGFMSILHGDDRIYNNIFVQQYPAREAEMHEDMGFISQDNRVVGTAVFDDYPTYQDWIQLFELDQAPNIHRVEAHHFHRLPVWINGNVYFNGAKSWNREETKLVDSTPVHVELVEEGTHWHLDTDLYQRLGGFQVGILNSDTLGYAFEPEQRFENPDGSDIIFDQDYFGEHRGISTLPGPFATPPSNPLV